MSHSPQSSSTQTTKSFNDEWTVGIDECGESAHVRFLAYRDREQLEDGSGHPGTAIYYYLRADDGTGVPAEDEIDLAHRRERRALPAGFQLWPPVGSHWSSTSDTCTSTGGDSDPGEGPSNAPTLPSHPRPNNLQTSNPLGGLVLATAYASSSDWLPATPLQVLLTGATTGHASAAGVSTDSETPSSPGLMMMPYAAMQTPPVTPTPPATIDDTTSRGDSATSGAPARPRIHDYGSTTSGNSTASGTVSLSITTGSIQAPERTMLQTLQAQSHPGSHTSSGYAPDRDSSSPSWSDVTLLESTSSSSTSTGSAGSFGSSFVGSNLGGLQPEDVLARDPVGATNVSNVSRGDRFFDSGVTTPTSGVRFPSSSAVPSTGLRDIGVSSSVGSSSSGSPAALGGEGAGTGRSSHSGTTSSSTSSSSDFSGRNFESLQPDPTSSYGVVSGSQTSSSVLPPRQQLANLPNRPLEVTRQQVDRVAMTSTVPRPRPVGQSHIGIPMTDESALISSSSTSSTSSTESLRSSSVQNLPTSAPSSRWNLSASPDNANPAAHTSSTDASSSSLSESEQASSSDAGSTVSRVSQSQAGISPQDVLANMNLQAPQTSLDRSRGSNVPRVDAPPDAQPVPRTTYLRRVTGRLNEE